MSTTQTEAPASALDLSKHKNTFVKQMWEKIVDRISSLKEVHEQIKAATPPTVAELDKELHSSSDPQVKEFRDAIARAEETLRVAREDAHKHILQAKHSPLSDEEQAKLKAQFAKLYQAANTPVGMLRDYAEMFDLTDVQNFLKTFMLPHLRGSARPGASAEVAPRPQIGSVVATRADGSTKTFGKFSDASIYTKVPTTQIRDGWLKAAEADTWQEVNQEITYKIGEVEFIVTPRDNESETDDSEE